MVTAVTAAATSSLPSRTAHLFSTLKSLAVRVGMTTRVTHPAAFSKKREKRKRRTPIKKEKKSRKKRKKEKKKRGHP